MAQMPTLWELCSMSLLSSRTRVGLSESVLKQDKLAQCDAQNLQEVRRWYELPNDLSKEELAENGQKVEERDRRKIAQNPKHGRLSVMHIKSN